MTRATAFVGTRRSGAALVALALIVFAVQAAAWPVQRGRDAWDYLIAYLSLADLETPFPLVMLVRPPVTPLVLGPAAQIGGATGLEVLGAVLFAGTVLAWAATALSFSRVAAAVVPLVLLAYAPFALPYHEPSSDMVVATGFAVLALGLTRTCLRPTGARFAALGAGVAALTLARPSYLVLLAAGAAVVLVPGGWGSRARLAGWFLAAALTPLALWAGHNGLRYGDVTVSRSGALNVPFYPAFLRGEIDPANGPASARLAALVEREILEEPAYRDLGVDARTYLRSGSNFEAVHLFGLSDRVFGLDAEYAVLQDAAREVPGGTRIRGVDLGASWRAARGWLTRLPPHESRAKPEQWPQPVPTVDVDGRPMPSPAALPPSPDAVPYGLLQCASDEIARCLLDDPSTVFGDPALASRYAEVTGTVARWDEGLGARAARTWLAARLESLRGLLPAPWLWLVVGAVLLGARRPSRASLIAAPAVLALLVLAVHALGGRGDPFFALPVLPALPAVAITAAGAPRRGSDDPLA